MNKIQKYYSPAKINLGLLVLNRRTDGFHNLYSLFIEIGLFDELVFTPSSDFELSIDCEDDIQLPLDNTNLISRAYKLMRSEAGDVPSEYAIHLKKLLKAMKL